MEEPALTVFLSLSQTGEHEALSHLSPSVPGSELCRAFSGKGPTPPLKVDSNLPSGCSPHSQCLRGPNGHSRVTCIPGWHSMLPRKEHAHPTFQSLRYASCLQRGLREVPARTRPHSWVSF